MHITVYGISQKKKTDIFEKKSFVLFSSISFPAPNLVLCTLDV